MRPQRTVPPAAAPLSIRNLWHGLCGMFHGDAYQARLKAEIREHLDVKYVFFVSSGKAALYLILRALSSLSPKQQTIIPAYTCFSVPSAIVKAGLEVGLCDIDPETLDFDHDLLQQAVNEDTLCVIPNHLFGIPSDMDQINRLCKDRGVFVVEDAAQVMGSKYNKKALGTIGDVGFFSLGRGKRITCGSGGIIVTNSKPIADAIEGEYATLSWPSSIGTIADFLRVLIMSIFINPALYWLPAGLPFLKLGETIFYDDFRVAKFSGMKAGLLYGWRENLERSDRIRVEMTEYYSDQLMFNSKPSLPYLRLPLLVHSRETRDRIYHESREQGLGVGPMYPTPVSAVKELKPRYDGMRFPMAEGVADKLLTLPTHHLLSRNDKIAICELFWGVNFSVPENASH